MSATEYILSCKAGLRIEELTSVGCNICRIIGPECSVLLLNGPKYIVRYMHLLGILRSISTHINRELTKHISVRN